MKITLEQLEQLRARARAATAMARPLIKSGDRISYTRCGGRQATFTFTHWQDSELCGKTTGCHAINIYAVNGQPVSFG